MTAKEKIEALNKAGIPVAGSPIEIPGLIKQAMSRKSGRSAGKYPVKAVATKSAASGTKKSIVKKSTKKVASSQKKRK